ncbi:MAG: spermidine/putrescine ABC transporter substrate-binding protein [Deltaproteobacteria bacterium]|uniref:Spermidine/putrescine ABC transporter substrate-binding protein n=1 Tax=Candidatus Zymogenus saltonus TaxID=2844893 RepID=A0A9D8PL62_9DELT|nr:spermidine/putrescine ABC transporter substrate-binding protein [Candidatus Zymogenus saltonus]
MVVVALLLCVSVLFWGCAKEEPAENKKLPDKITILNWEEYMEMDVVKEFEKEYNIKVEFVYYVNEHEMISIIQSDPGNYDLAVASGSIVETMINLKLLERIDKNNIPNLSKVDKKFRIPPFDKNLDYSIPYLWGTSGLAVNRKYVKDEDIGWEILFDKRFKGKIDILDDIQEIFAPPLKILGVSINTEDERSLEAAKALLVEQKGIIRGYFDTIEIMKHLEDGTTYVAYLYSGDTYTAKDKNEYLDYIVPDDGAPMWIDNFVIPTNSKNKYAAELFINYVLKPKNIARISNYLWYANAVPESKRFLNEELLNTENIYLTDEVLKRCEYYKPLMGKRNIFMNRVWAELTR